MDLLLNEKQFYSIKTTLKLKFSTSKLRGRTVVSLQNLPFDVGRLVVVIDVNPSHGFWTRRLMKLFGHEGK
jgi:hypothetical protein